MPDPFSLLLYVKERAVHSSTFLLHFMCLKTANHTGCNTGALFLGELCL